MSRRVAVLGLLELLWPIGARQLLPQLVLLLDDVQGMAQVDQRRRGHEDDLQDPEADVRDGEDLVVADVLATGLLGVADKIRLLISPDTFGTCSQNHDPEQEEDAHPDLPNHSGVGLDFFQQCGQKTPVSHLC